MNGPRLWGRELSPEAEWEAPQLCHGRWDGTPAGVPHRQQVPASREGATWGWSQEGRVWREQPHWPPRVWDRSLSRPGLGPPHPLSNHAQPASPLRPALPRAHPLHSGAVRGSWVPLWPPDYHLRSVPRARCLPTGAQRWHPSKFWEATLGIPDHPHLLLPHPCPGPPGLEGLPLPSTQLCPWLLSPSTPTSWG